MEPNKIRKCTKEKLKLWLRRNKFLALTASRFFVFLHGVLAIRYRFKHIFRNHIAWSSRITGWNSIKIGSNIVIGSGTWININQRNEHFKSMIISDNVFIGRNNFFTVGKNLRIREFCLTASNCSFIGSSHVNVNPMVPYITSGTTETDCIYLGVNCFLGYGAMVIGDVTVGHGSIIGAGCLVRGHIPPFSIVVGNPCKIIRRYCFSQSAWVKVEQSDNIQFPCEEDYLEALKQGFPYILQPLSAAVDFLGDI